MKKISVFLIAILCSLTGFSQSSQNEIDLIQSVYGMEKKELVTSFVELDDDQKVAFWELYDTYEVKRNELGKERFDMLNKYVSDYGEIAHENADGIMKDGISLRKKSDKLIDGYYKKIKNKTDPVVALQFYQLERYLSDLIRISLLEELYTLKK
ncbi:MAG: hypothetical protein KAH07_01605 [Flavobacteriaceae bacterium]|nr:hypothetical protein [Flavobacteriaceae bacterium]